MSSRCRSASIIEHLTQNPSTLQPGKHRFSYNQMEAGSGGINFPTYANQQPFTSIWKCSLSLSAPFTNRMQSFDNIYFQLHLDHEKPLSLGARQQTPFVHVLSNQILSLKLIKPDHFPFASISNGTKYGNHFPPVSPYRSYWYIKRCIPIMAMNCILRQANKF